MTNKELIEAIKADIRRKVNSIIDEYEQLVKYEVWIDANKIAIKIKAYKEVLSYLDTLSVDEKDYKKLYEDIANSDWFKKSYVGKSLGDFIEVDGADVYRF